MQHLGLVVGQYGEHEELLYIFCFPSSQVIGMLRSVPEDDRGAVIVSTPSTDRQEVTSALVTPAGSLYFLRNSLDTKPWSSYEQNNHYITENLSRNFCTPLTSSSNLSGFMSGVYCDELVINTNRQLLRWEMLHIQIDDVAVLLGAHLDKQYSCYKHYSHNWAEKHTATCYLSGNNSKTKWRVKPCWW